MRFCTRRSFCVTVTAFLAGWVVSAPAPAFAEKVESPVVVELFTSQGCETCPPADRLLGSLAQRADVVALSLHVDYWDYIGWIDPFADPQHTARQRAYVNRLPGRHAFTPQIVIDGREQASGSREEAVTDAIQRAREERKLVQPRFEMNDDAPRLVIPKAEIDGPATIWLAIYNYEETTDVLAGENEGKRLLNYNVVHKMKRLATWTGEEIEIELDIERAVKAGYEACAVIIQRDDMGPVVGAVAMPLPTMDM